MHNGMARWKLRNMKVISENYLKRFFSDKNTKNDKSNFRGFPLFLEYAKWRMSRLKR
jgi:hypothetical protein